MTTHFEVESHFVPVAPLPLPDEDLIIEKIRRKIKDAGEEPFYLIDLETLCERHALWISTLPMVTPHYAVKCNPNPALLHTLERLGCGFDCASRDEIDRVMDMGIDSSRIVFANPCKMENHIAHAKLRGINRMTFDNEDELVKVARVYPEAQMILRIITDDSSSLCQFSSKYGAPLSTVRPILSLARELGVDVVGVSFHVGSGCADASAFRAACQDALKIFKIAKEEFGFDFHVLDIGGGFQGTDDVKPTLAEVASYLIPEFAKFPLGTEFCAEPGRYFATKSHTLVTPIHSRRVIRDPVTGEPIKALYYIGDGVYHSFNCIFFDHQHPLPSVLPPLVDDRTSFDQMKKIPCTVFGPTCDSLDCICTDYPMPLLNVGDWLYFRNMGSYTTCATTRFNGFSGTVACHYFWGPTFVENVMGVVVQGEFPGLPAVHHPSFVPVPSRSPEPQQMQQQPTSCCEQERPQEINLLNSFVALNAATI